MFQCNSGKHSWTSKDDAGYCCKPEFVRVLATDPETRAKAVGHEIQSAIGLPFVWIAREKEERTSP